MPLQKLPVVDLDNVNHRRRARETLNNVLDHSFDDSRRHTDMEKLANVTPINPAFQPGDLRRYTNDYTASAHSAFAMADAQATQGGAPIRVPRIKDGWVTSEPLTVSAGNDLVFEPGAYITYTGSANVSALTIGEVGLATVQKQYTGIRVLRANQSNWSNGDNIAVRLINIVRSSIQVLEATNSTIGVQCIGSDGGFYANTIELGLLLNNGFALDLNNQESTGTGYCNSNYFFGGYLTNDTSLNTATARYGVRITSAAGTPYYNNANVFYNLTFELNTNGGSSTAIPVLCSYATQNEFYDCRDELNSVPFLINENDSVDNIVHQSYAAQSMVSNTGIYKHNFVFNRRRFALDHFTPSWQSPALHRCANEYSASSDAYFAGMSVMQSTTSNFLRAATNFAFTDDYVTVPATRAVGIMVDTRRQKRFVLRRDSDASFGGRFIVACLDSSKARLTGTSPNYAVGVPGVGFTYTTDFGGVYQTNSDSTDDVFVAVDDDVTWMWVGVSGGTADAHLRSIAIQSPEGAITAFQGFTDGTDAFYNDDRHYANNAPNNNIGIHYPKGFRISRASTSVAAGAPGWLCTTAGTGGTAVFKIEAAVAA